MNTNEILKANADLVQVALELLKKCPRHLSYKAIADASGLEPSWISAFKRKVMKDPGYYKVCKLHSYLITVVQA